MKFFMFKLLKALDYTHSKGIFHGGIKPQNIIFHAKNKMLKLIDWGKADYYIPGLNR